MKPIYIWSFYAPKHMECYNMRPQTLVSLLLTAFLFAVEYHNYDPVSTG